MDIQKTVLVVDDAQRTDLYFATYYILTIL